MSFVYIAAHPQQVNLARSVMESLDGAGIMTWYKGPQFDWDSQRDEAVLRNILKASAVLLIVDDADALDPPDFMRDILEAKRLEKPLFIIKTKQQLDLLLPQIRQRLPRSHGVFPLPMISIEAALPPQAPVHIHPGWLEMLLLTLLTVLIVVIIAMVAR